MGITIRQLFEQHQGKVSDKWQLYLDEWDRLLAIYQDQAISLLEIGIQNGGSLEIWGKYFVNAENIIGCDVDQQCESLRYDDSRIRVLVGDVNSDDCRTKILQLTPTLDIVIDDGSHKSSDIIRAFGRLFPYLKDGGKYIIEDLHSSYWYDFGGGLYNPLSSIAFFKRLADIVNFEHWRNNQPRRHLLNRFESEYQITFNDLILARIHSIEFINSLCIVTKLSPEKNMLGKRVVVGIDDRIAGGWDKLNGTDIQDITVEVKDDVNSDIFELINHNKVLIKIIAERDELIQNLSEQIKEKDQNAISLQKRTGETEQELLVVKDKLLEMEQSIHFLSAQIKEKEHVEKEQHSQFEQQLYEYRSNLSQKVQTIHTLFSRLAKKQSELENAESEVVDLNIKLSVITQRENTFSSQLWEIQHSRAWRLIQIIWGLRIRLFPSGSFQSRLIRLIVRGVRIIKNEGVIAFLKRSFHLIYRFIPQYVGSQKTLAKEIQSPEPKITLVYPNPIYISDTAEEKETTLSGVYTAPFIADDPVDLLERVMGNLKNHKYLVSISHDDYLSVNFGVQLFINDEQKLFDKKHISYIHLYPINGDDYLKNNSALIIGLNVDSQSLGQYDETEIKKLLQNLIAKKYTCVSINLHQFKGWTFIALKNVISVLHPEHLFFYLHDYYAVCPQYTLLRNRQEFCNAPQIESNACTICIFKEKRKVHLPVVKKLFNSFPFIIIAPSKSARNLWKKALPQLNNEIRIVPHILLKKTSLPLSVRDHKVIRIAYAGQASQFKGWNAWRKLVNQFDSYMDYEMFHLGSPVGDQIENIEHIRVTPKNRTAMLDALRTHQIDVLFHWSVLPETFSFVLYEAIGAGCFIITTNKSGNVADYVTEHKNGRIFSSYEQLTNYLSTPENLRNDLLDFQKRYPNIFNLKNNEAIVNLIMNS